MTHATITSKGQVTIPKDIRQQLDLKTGDRIDFILGNAGEVVIRRVTNSTADVRGILAHRAQAPLTVEQMDDAVRQRFKSRRS